METRCSRAEDRRFWLEARGVRDQITVITKGGHPDGERSRIRALDLAADVAGSRERLRAPKLDVFLLHRDDESVPAATCVDILDSLARGGEVAAVGVSNWTMTRVRAAHAYAQQHGKIAWSMVSPHFSLAEWRRPPWPGCVSIAGQAGAEAVEVYRSFDLAVLAWSSLAAGFFSGRLQRGVRVASTADKQCSFSYASDANWQRLERASELAVARGTSAAVVALAYVLSVAPHTFAVVASRSAEHLDQLARVADIALTPGEMDWLAGFSVASSLNEA